MADIQKLKVNSTTYDISTTWDKVTGKPNTFPSEAHSHDYLPLTGGTIDGSIKLGKSDNTAYRFLRIIRSGSIVELTNSGGLGALTIDGFGFTFNTKDSYWNSNTLIHSGNIGDYKAGDSDKLGGITSNGFVQFKNDSASIFGAFTNIPIIKTSYISAQGGDNCLIQLPLWSNNVSSKYYTAEIRTILNGTPSFRTVQNGTATDWREFAFTDSNVASANYATSAGSVPWSGVTEKPSTFPPESHTHPYLPLSGGTIDGTTNDVPLTIKSNGGTTWLNIVPRDGISRYIGVDVENNLKYQYGSNSYYVIHAGNIGDQSVKYATTSNGMDNVGVANLASARLQFWWDWGENSITGYGGAYKYGLHIGSPDPNYYFQVGISTAYNGLYGRFKNAGTWGSWREIAFTDSNVTSASSVPWSGVTGKPSTFPVEAHTHSYLPLSGGTLGSTANITWADRGAWGNSSATYPYEYGGLTWNGTSDWIKIFGKEEGSDQLNLIIKFGDDAGHAVKINDNGAEYTVLHTGNLTKVSQLTNDAGYKTTDTNTWRPVTNTYTGSDQSTCVSQKGTNDLYNALVNGYASSAGSVPWSGVTGKPVLPVYYNLSGSDAYSILKNNATSFARNQLVHAYLGHGSASFAMGWVLSGYDSGPYCAFIVNGYGDNWSLVGSSAGTWTHRTLLHSGNISSYALTSLPSHTHTKSQITDFPSSMPASDVHAWAKAASKPSYTASEVGAFPVTGGNMYGDNCWIGSTMGGGTDSWRIGGYGSGDNGECRITINDNSNDVFAIQIEDYSGTIYRPMIVKNTGVYGTAFYQDSDERLKTFYDPIKVDLEKLKKLRKNYFKFNDKDKLEIGVSAQEIQSLYPEIVSTNDEGYLSVAYDKLSVIALAALDEQQNIIEDQNNKINQLEERLKAIENILNEKGIL